MSGPSLEDFKPEAFTLEKYVEKLAQLNPDTGLGPLSKSKSKPFEPQVLLESFEASMHVLEDLTEKNQRKVDKLEHVCVKREEEHRNRIKDLDSTYSDAFTEFQALEERITNVSTKVVHLGDQLESLNHRRMRAVEAQSLMTYLGEFEEKSKPSIPMFTDPARKLDAADLIFKLYTLSRELPSEKKYTNVKQNINAKFAETESQLVDGFIDSLQSLDTRRMKEYAQALQSFNLGTARVVENYIVHNMPKATHYSCADEMFSVVEGKCRKAHDQMVEVFHNPDVVLIKFLQAIVDKVLGKYIDQELQGLKLQSGDKERYLVRLHALYQKSMALQQNIGKFDASIEQSFLSKMIRVNLFMKYLTSYSEMELAHLKFRCDHALSDFQDMVGISLRPGGKSVTISQGDPGETFVSQEVCTSILHEAKGSIRRAQDLLGERELSELVQGVYFAILDKVCTEHFHTALDIGQNVDPKMSPVGHFCVVVGNVNCNMHLVDKLFREAILPCIHIPSAATNCVEKKRDVISKLEAKIESGIEKNLGWMVSTVKSILVAYQKKTDYKPEGIAVAEGSQACSRSVTYMSQCCRVLSESLDGKNLEAVLLELGTRLHKVIFEHVQTHSINEMGAMILICDMNEYRRVIKDFKNPFLDELYESLQTLCNIFVVKADNLHQVLSEEPYVNFDRAVLQALVAARADNKSAKLSKMF
ncbi:exocyst complex component 5-like [Halichondria panicea]|uniref:exocyst complex component 5-like n=1 Tax=Halichondria panicea TaxID=6063 RepID=UPI00312B4772